MVRREIRIRQTERRARGIFTMCQTADFLKSRFSFRIMQAHGEREHVRAGGRRGNENYFPSGPRPRRASGLREFRARAFRDQAWVIIPFMDRRKFLSLFSAGVAGIALEQAIPLGRVWSFPEKDRDRGPASSMSGEIAFYMRTGSR